MNKPLPANELLLLPLGGTGEIGMNAYAYGAGGARDRPRDRQWLLVDLGVKFGDDKDPGIDVVLPDVAFLSQRRKKLQGLVLTHAHEDHIGAVPWLWPQLRCPIYCTAFTAALLRNKLEEHGLEEQVSVTVLKPGEKFTLGLFNLEFVNLSHSIPEPQGLLIETEGARVFHSGDWKLDRTPIFNAPPDEARLRQIGAAGLDALVCDSTNVLREGLSPSESDVAHVLQDIVAEAKARVTITTFASHVERVSSAIKAGRLAGREVIIAGRAMRRTIEAAQACGYLKDAGPLLDEEEFGYLPPNKTLLICTGSQGEPRAAIARIAEDQHPHISLGTDDLVVFSSRTIPGNEKAVGSVINNLAKLDVDVMTSDDALVHSSGHPRQGELRWLYDLLKPKALVPMHGEARHLREHIKFAKSCGIANVIAPQDGAIIRLCPLPLALWEEGEAGRLHLDGKLIVPSVDGPAKQRRKLSFAGIVIIIISVDDMLQLERDIEVICDGLPAALETDLLEAAEDAYRSMPRGKRRDDDQLIEVIRNAIRRRADDVWGKKPVCRVIIQR